ncbi:hypothetical protein AVEN_86024-1 [Araneus ventricosus]|uniref:Uncharacterized protein n=1 Tax=Araneus ventricosus TaxID=182803 RepID=A0A4Y2U2U2_ARAVE|nr:hypothetical protein AVEN_86024-1 [Araneus ventricosus]
MNFHAMEVAEMPDVTSENNILERTQDILEEGYAMEENTFHGVRKTVEDIVEIIAVVEEDILETVMVTEDIVETVTVIEDDLIETVTAAEDILQFVETDGNVSDSSAGSGNKTMKSFVRAENDVLFQKNVWCKSQKEGIFDKGSENGIAKETAITLLADNALPSREDIQSLRQLINYFSSEDSNQIPCKGIAEKINEPELISQYAGYRRSRNNNLSTLYDSRIVMDEWLEECSFIAQQCRIAITDTDPTPDISAVSEQELETMNRSLMEKVRVYKECLRSMCWNLDSIDNKIRQCKKLNNTIDMKRDKFLNFSFSNEKKND